MTPDELKSIDPAEAFMMEIAVREIVEGSFTSFGYLPDPDYILQKLGTDTAVYREIMTEPTVEAALTQRKAGVLSLEWDIARGRQPNERTDLIKNIFENFDVEDINDQILNCIPLGFQPIEVIWEYDGKYLIPAKVIPKPQEWFVFGKDNQLKLKTLDSATGQDVPSYKFILARHKATYQNPYGNRLMSKCYWPVVLKRAVAKFWATMTEKYGMPHAYGTFKPGFTDKLKQEFLNYLQKMVRDSVAIFPEGAGINLIDAQSRSSSADIYDKFIRFADKEILKVILSTSLTVETNDRGVYSSANVQQQAVFSINDSDKRIVEKVWNTLIKWIYELNFNNYNLSEVEKFQLYEEEDVDKALADRDKTLSETGVKFTKQYFKSAYNLKDEDFELADIAPAAPVIGLSEFKESKSKSSRDKIEDIFNAIPDKVLQLQISQTLAPVIDLINESSDYSEIKTKLVKLYPKMETSQLESLLQKAIFVSEIWGRINNA